MIDTFDTLFLAAVALLVLYLYLTWNYNYWTKAGIPSEKPSLVFGNLFDSILGKRGTGEIFIDIYSKYPGEKVVGWFKFRTPGLMIRDPELIHRILVTDFQYFRNNDNHLDENIDPVLGNNLFVLRDEKWKKGRALITPAFTIGKIKATYPFMKEVAAEMVDYIREHPEEQHMKHLMSRYTAEITARCALGIEGRSFKEPKPELYEVGKMMFEPSPVVSMKFFIFFMAPALGKLMRLQIVPTKVLDFFKSVLRDVIIYRQENNVERSDIVQYLIEVKRKALEVAKGNIQSDVIDKIYTDDDILMGCTTFFIDGYETSSNILNNILYQLALNKTVQETLRNEIDATLKEGELTFEKLQEMRYLNSVFLEANRILPAIYHLQKLCTETYKMDIGKEKPLVIEKGTSLILPLYAIHNDPLYWEDPEVFKPERFANKEEANAKAKGVYFPFGDGPRMCPGMRMATIVIKTALVHILSNFEILPTSKTPKKIQFDPLNFLISNKGGIYLRLSERPKKN